MSDDVKNESVELEDLSASAGAQQAEPAQASAPDSAASQPPEAPPQPETDVASGQPDDGENSEEPSRAVSELEAVFDVPVGVAAVLGRTNIEVSNLLALNEGDVVELDRKVGEAIDIFINNRLIARGEVVLVEDRLGVTMTEIIKGEQTV
jgi:flagellar motor switch protein FliN/FliY